MQVMFAVDRLQWLHTHRRLIGGLEWVEEPEILRFFYGAVGWALGGPGRPWAACLCRPWLVCERRQHGGEPARRASPPPHPRPPHSTPTVCPAGRLAPINNWQQKLAAQFKADFGESL